MELGSKLFTDLWTNALLTWDLGQVSISRASRSMALALVPGHGDSGDPRRGHTVPSPLQSPKDWSPWCQQPWASVGVVPGGSEEWMASPGQKYLLGLESTAVRPTYKKPCALKMMFSSFSVWTDFKRFCGPSQDYRLGIVTLMESHFPLSELVSPRLTASKSSPQHTWGYSEAFYTSQVW